MNQEASEKKTSVEPGTVPDVPPNPPQIPDHQLLRRIGGGSYGDVWLAKSVMGTYRAVKIVYRKTFSSDRPYEREFTGIQKFEPLSRSHESLVDLLHVGRNDRAGYFFYVMELADDAAAGSPTSKVQIPKSDGTGRSGLVGGGDEKTGSRDNETDSFSRPPVLPFSSAETYVPKTLTRVLRDHGRLPVEECISLALSLTSALGYLHKRGLIHRDLKPSNIIFVDGIPKLADIGLVADTRDARTFVGTEGFIPPEGPGTAQADLYSLGKVLYEISTGKDRQDYPELPTDLPDLASREELLKFHEMIAKACDSDPRQRYHSAEEMRADLLALQNGARASAAGLANWINNTDANLARSRWPFWRRLIFLGALLLALGVALVLQQHGAARRNENTTTAAGAASAKPLPPGIASLPAAEVLKIVYGEAPPGLTGVTARPQLQFELFAFPDGANEFKRLTDGDSLRSETDDYLIAARALSAGYLYVFQIDSSGHKDWLFPKNASSQFSSGSNPVAPGQFIQVPSTNTGRALFLDRKTGVEHIYAVFSGARWPALEEALSRPNPSPERSSSTLMARRVEEPNRLLTRGVGGTRTNLTAVNLSEAMQRLHHGQNYTLNLSSPILEASGAFVALERWFEHIESEKP